MRNTTYEALTVMLIGAFHRLHPGRASRQPGLFFLEVAAALLSVLALRDKIAGGPAVSLECVAAAGLWAILLLAACGLSARMPAVSVIRRGRASNPALR